MHKAVEGYGRSTSMTVRVVRVIVLHAWNGMRSVSKKGIGKEKVMIVPHVA